MLTTFVVIIEDYISYKPFPDLSVAKINLLQNESYNFVVPITDFLINLPGKLKPHINTQEVNFKFFNV